MVSVSKLVYEFCWLSPKGVGCWVLDAEFDWPPCWFLWRYGFGLAGKYFFTYYELDEASEQLWFESVVFYKIETLRFNSGSIGKLLFYCGLALSYMDMFELSFN